MFQRWLSWLVLGLFLYLMVQGSPRKPVTTSPVKVVHEQTAPAPETLESTPAPAAAPHPQPVAESRTVNTMAQASDLERWKRVINPDYAKKFQCTLNLPQQKTDHLQWKLTEDKLGEGSAASCSETIPVKLTVWNARGEVAYTATEEIVIGARQVAAGLDAALVGIRPGGIRTVVMGPQALEHDKDMTLPKSLAAAFGKNNLVVLTVERLK